MVQYSIDVGFAALADPTRRGVLEHLARREASITELAASFDMTLTGMKKHVQLLEEAGFLATEKVGRVRVCRLGTHNLEREQAWIANYRRVLEERFDHLDQLIARHSKGEIK